jgi:hypothetical protein
MPTPIVGTQYSVLDAPIRTNLLMMTKYIRVTGRALRNPVNKIEDHRTDKTSK